MTSIFQLNDICMTKYLFIHISFYVTFHFADENRQNHDFDEKNNNSGVRGSPVTGDWATLLPSPLPSCEILSPPLISVAGDWQR